jgi:EAL domain-containing protein (putative c-di-GMP-specific phosphodiesterase class I)
LVGSIVEIARALSVEVIAEGVETEDHARLLARAGCDGLQGYAIGYPSSVNEIAVLLTSVQRPDLHGASGNSQGNAGPTGFVGRQSAHS